MCIRPFNPCTAFLAFVLCLCAASPPAQAQCELDELFGSQLSAVAHFGSSVSISGDLLIVGAELDYSPIMKAGSAFIYRREGAHWIEEAKLTASDQAFLDRLGFSVAISGGLAVAGAFGHDDMGEGSGAVFVFRREGTSWVEEAELYASDPADNHGFGFTIDVDGETIVVGAAGDDEGGDDAGAVYVFHRDDNATPGDPSDDFWFEEAKLIASDVSAGDFFGFSMSISGDLLIVGSRDDDAAGQGSGSAYIYRREGSDWIEEAKLVGSDLGEWESFAQSVSLDGEVAVVGARNHEHADPANGIGVVYVFRRQDNGTPADPSDDYWVEEAELTDPDAVDGDRLGWEVGISGERIIAGGALNHDPDDKRRVVCVFERVGSAWVKTAELSGSDAQEGDFFATHLSISGDFVVAGAPGHDDVGGNVGAAYVFAVGGEDCNANDNPDLCEMDTDGDGVIDDCDPCPIDNPDDTDDDGVCDSDDACPGFDDRLDDDGDHIPNDCDICPLGEDDLDSDGDGTPDACDGCPFDSAKTDPGICGCGELDEGDTDGDNTLDCVDRCPGVDDTVFAPECVAAIPTVSQWGIAIMTLLLLAVAKIRFRARA